MDIKAITNATAQVLMSYLTYQAIRVVAAQLRETDPPRAVWFSQFSTQATLQDGEAYLEQLTTQNPDLAFRVMTVREHLAEQVVDSLPELTRDGIRRANQQRRGRYIEQMLQLPSPESRGENP
ncbi:chaperonin family protein RbcX [Gloeobacter kilaueensis]|uniref:Uncharacterized protein n=1 Tax=Gloeobacter kilaueensis (strain ATCC BAA-2537 / CCAP 1431/1 / ULC 316 / JS1) TaxID=1183438 RepID=U5QH29_GLOK1|nr:chaperonin family protein RbcX [Gloeobacter kilaueensis]AGY56914.1 hypothetical protein GKIL_0668 [Gloeobacter kilaueensis JS1]